MPEVTQPDEDDLLKESESIMNHVPLLFNAIFGVFLTCILAINPATDIVSHRGISSEYPENTLEAFAEVLDQNVDGIELDVYEGSDKSVLVFHDANLKKMTGVDKYIWELTKESRKDYPIKGKYTIPILEEVLDLIKDKQVSLYIHIKHPDLPEYRASVLFVKTIEKKIVDYDMQDRTTVFSDETTMEHFSGNTSLNCGIIFSKGTFEKFKEYIRNWEHKGVSTFIFMNNTNFRDKKNQNIIKYLHEHGKKVGLYAEDPYKTIGKAIEYKLDFVIT